MNETTSCLDTATLFNVYKSISNDESSLAFNVLNFCLGEVLLNAFATVCGCVGDGEKHFSIAHTDCEAFSTR